uniref:Alpha/beta hydrolase fold-3 domain-containing protein n=1 Tax=Kwoniella dejecticola CBS 10117 TaxID=1296121 RepID=A0A1A6A4B8_9TREE|nr:uncharacterized protein I303_04228 [Kwoniella dejecticola CBS 10117]OBR84906.1 hypothetical protein I303_04228 [Kwoniella dejecticola CBS 10117]
MVNSAGPLVLETLFKHFIGPRPSADKGKAREDLMYDEAFVLMKTFLEIATKYPVAALQRFGQVRTPSPPWVGVHRVTIPRTSLNDAAMYMIDGFGGEEMAYKIAGGTKWWQVRAGQGVEGEWIVMKKDWRGAVEEERRERERREKDGETEDDDGEFRPEMDRLRCMLYIHGGAYYWGSINTHRYTIWRYARKMHGRCFAVNYRKTPQYPFPCAIQDCLAAYIYLTNPPPGSQHRPVDPKSIILAGDSAGGGLCLALLQILRDTPGLELPAGAVLISPWSDLTHSFPSILQNTATDIVPPYGFIHKPSSLWPPPPPTLTEEVQSTLRTRVREAVNKLHHHPHKAAELHKELEKTTLEEQSISTIGRPTTVPDKLKTSDPSGGLEKSNEQDEEDLHPLADKSENQHPEPRNEPSGNPSRANPAQLFSKLSPKSQASTAHATGANTLAQCDIPLKLTVKSEEILIDTQIQLYATNAQLCHPWVSPVLGYLGGLPPLFVMCGDKEVLRDEIIFLAHKAANPDAYPIRDDVKALLPSLHGIEEKHSSTNVHLQVYDGVCHDLPLLSMTRPSRGAFRAIASFARYVTPSAPGSRYISRSFPATPKGSKDGTPRGSTSNPSNRGTLHSLSTDNSAGVPSTPITNDQKIIEGVLTDTPAALSPKQSTMSSKKPPILDLGLGDQLDKVITAPLTDEADLTLPEANTPQHEDSRDQLNLKTPSRNVSFASSYNSSVGSTERDRQRKESILPPSPDPRNGSGSHIDAGKPKHRGNSQPSGDDSGPRFEDGEQYTNDWKAKEGEAGWAGIYSGDNPFTNHMIRERVSTIGELRPLEPAEELQAMQMPLDEVGTIKEGPAMRYINGQALWDKKYHRAAKGVKRRREKNLKIAQKEGGKIGHQWIHNIERKRLLNDSEKQQSKQGIDDNESTVITSAEKGDDTKDKVSGMDKDDQIDWSESWTWALNGESPPPSAIVSRRDFSEARQLALMADRLDSSHSTGMHGLSIWVGLASFFSNSNERNKASQAVKAAREVKKLEKQSQKQDGQSPKRQDGEERDIWTDLDDPEGEAEEHGDGTDPPNSQSHIGTEEMAGMQNEEGRIRTLDQSSINRYTDLNRKSASSSLPLADKNKAVRGQKERKTKGKGKGKGKGVIASWFAGLKKKSGKTDTKAETDVL